MKVSEVKAHRIIMSLLTIGGIANNLRPFGMEFFLCLNKGLNRVFKRIILINDKRNERRILMYKKVELSNGFVGLEKEITNLWTARNVIKKNFDMNQDGEYFTFYDGPPTANGRPHVGHVLTRVMKDIIPRYKVMNGV